MRLGASGYLLKTAFEDEELEAMLGKFQRELSDAPAHGYELEEQVSAHLLLGSTGTVTVSLENSESFAAASGWERASPSRCI